MSDLRRQLIEQVGVAARIDLAPEELGGGGDGDAGYLAPQALARARGLELDLLLRVGDDARALGARLPLGLLDDVAGGMLGVIDDLVGALARLAHDGIGASACLGQLVLALFRSREPLDD